MKEKPRCEINVTPLVDVCLVMLIIFMVVTPMIVERVVLPRTERPDETVASFRRQRAIGISLRPLAPPQARAVFFS